MELSSFAYQISYARQKKGFSQEQLGQAVGVSNKAVSKWERGVARPRAGLIARLAEILDLPLDVFLDAGERKGFSLRNDARYSGMPSLVELYRIGHGPSSSHTMAPKHAAELFAARFADADRYEVTFYGSLAYTCKSYGTEGVLSALFAPRPLTATYDTWTWDLPHPNTFDLRAYREDEQIGRWRVFSTGGGSIRTEGEDLAPTPLCYPHSTYDSIFAYCQSKQIRLWQYVAQWEGDAVWGYLQSIWDAMRASIRAGLTARGALPGDLQVERKANHLLSQEKAAETPEMRQNRLVSAYAFAVSEENAAGGQIVTAPTCGACGVLPAVLLYAQEKEGFTDAQILHALATASLIGNLIKKNASISGAECGCQAEIGSACSMAAAALAELYDMELSQIEYAAEIAIEHHLGLTCDPIHGLIQIPCIERNAVAAMRAINAVHLANFLSDSRKISFDLVVQTMYETGKDLSKSYRETGQGGLAKLYP